MLKLPSYRLAHVFAVRMDEDCESRRNLPVHNRVFCLSLYCGVRYEGDDDQRKWRAHEGRICFDIISESNSQWGCLICLVTSLCKHWKLTHGPCFWAQWIEYHKQKNAKEIVDKLKCYTCHVKHNRLTILRFHVASNKDAVCELVLIKASSLSLSFTILSTRTSP